MAPMTDRARKGILDAIVLLSLAALLAVVVASVGLLHISIALQTAVLAGAAAALAGCSFLFNTIDWKDLRGSEGPRILHRGRADLILTMVSITALFTVVVMVIFELFALAAFMGAIDVGATGAQVASNFVLIQTIILLVYLLALLARQTNPSRYEPRKGSRMLALVLTPLALLLMASGTLLAFGIGTAALGLKVTQAVYIVTLGVLLEFIAMRIRLALPSLWSMFSKAMKEARKSDEEGQEHIRRRALQMYVGASVFVALSMAMVGALATNTVNVGDPAILWAVGVFYVGGAMVILGMVAIRVLQHRTVHRPEGIEGDELSRLVRQRRRAPEEIFRIAVYIFTGLLAVCALALCVLTALDMMSWHRKFATDLFILAVLFGAGPVGIFYNRDRKRIASIDQKFPDFLRDLAESSRAGMTLPKALVTASEGSYGALNPEIKTMAAQVQWGVEFGEALTRFAERCKTPLIDRTVALVVEAQRAGGSVIDVLTAASEDAREIKQIVAERTAQMSMYNVVIYIAYMVFIVVVLVLALQFIPAFKGAVGAASQSGQAQVGGLQFHDFDIEDFNTVFFQAAVVQAIGGGLVGGVLTKGSPIAGFPHVGIMLLFAWLAFRVLVGLSQGAPPASVGG